MWSMVPHLCTCFSGSWTSQVEMPLGSWIYGSSLQRNWAREINLVVITMWVAFEVLFMDGIIQGELL